MTETAASCVSASSQHAARPVGATHWPHLETRDWCSRTQQLFATAREDIARLIQTVRGLPCTAILRGVDGLVLPLIAGHIASLLTGERTLSAPVYDADGTLLAVIELVSADAELTDAAEALLRAMVQSAARSITERWFRICHRRQWVVAALRDGEAHTFAFLAVDDARRLVGADYQARQILSARGKEFAYGLPLSGFFQVDALPFGRLRYCDTTMRLYGRAAPWSVLITPPYHGASQLYYDERVLLHARPRLDTIKRPTPRSPEDEAERGLRPWMLRRIEAYIDAHIDSALNIDELAGVLDISKSHFTRCFHHSFGVAPHSYVIQRKLQRAQEMLVQSNLALGDIALKTGFSDPSHFSRRFHQVIGVSPKAFRAQHR